MGFDVIALNQFGDVESQCFEFKPDVILLEINRQLDGIKLLYCLARQDADVDIILMSSVDGRIIQDTERLARLLGLNIVGALPKPIEIDKLKRLLSKEC